MVKENVVVDAGAVPVTVIVFVFFCAFDAAVIVNTTAHVEFGVQVPEAGTGVAVT